MEQGNSRRKRRRQNKCRLLEIPAVIIVVLLCMGVLIWGRHGPKHLLDPNAVDNANKPLTEAELLRELQNAADESAFRFKVNSLVTVAPAGAASADQSTSIPSNEAEGVQPGSGQIGDWNIINSIQNSCDMEVSITGKDGTALYESRLLHPGEQELTGALKTHLEPGTYEAEAVAKAIDPENGEVLGNVTAEITVTVQNEETVEPPAETGETTSSEG